MHRVIDCTPEQARLSATVAADALREAGAASTARDGSLEVTYDLNPSTAFAAANLGREKAGMAPHESVRGMLLSMWYYADEDTERARIETWARRWGYEVGQR